MACGAHVHHLSPGCHRGLGCTDSLSLWPSRPCASVMCAIATSSSPQVVVYRLGPSAHTGATRGAHWSSWGSPSSRRCSNMRPALHGRSAPFCCRAGSDRTSDRTMPGSTQSRSRTRGVWKESHENMRKIPFLVANPRFSTKVSNVALTEGVTRRHPGLRV